MAEEVVHKQKFLVRDLSTRCVTLYPSRTQVIRDIDDITLKPGANEITIFGLTPTADESSIKVDGKGSATITDMTVKLVPNRDAYEDIYPEESDDEEAMDQDDESSDDEPALIKSLTQEKKQNNDMKKQASEEKASASARLAMLENYARSLEKDRPADLEGCINLYRGERKKAYDDHFASEARLIDLENSRANIEKQLNRALRAISKEKQKATKEQTKMLEKKRRARKEKLKAKTRLREERIKFWPRKNYRITLSLYTNSDMTPATSRRGSVNSLAKTISEDFCSSTRISQSISYVTHSAWWTPGYDLSIDTLKSSGSIVYRAEFCNTTSETWNDAKVILSTSQTAFQGLGDSIPSMQPWHVRLSKEVLQGVDRTSGALFSTHEVIHKQRADIIGSNRLIEPRSTLFGLSSNFQHCNLLATQDADHRPQQMQPQQQMQGQMRMQQQCQQSTLPSNLFGAANSQMTQGGLNGGGLFGGFSAASQPSALGQQSAEKNESFGSTLEPIIPELPSLATQESEWSETGMTATYEIPGRRTVAPSDTKRRHKIAAIDLKDAHLSYLLVPKLRAAAFLKARIRNTSSITLLKGPVGLTLDGSFLGNASLPHCSAGEPFSLSLGVDPSVNVTYSKPVVKRSQTGVFQKEGSGIYTRTCTVTNTNSDRPLQGLVMDQVPVSEDERLRTDILLPSGLRNEGDTAKSGTGIPAVGKDTEKWGSAKATLKKAGEICWNINLEPGRGVKLVLEYETRFPSNEAVVGCCQSQALPGLPSSEDALQDWQMQLMLLEQQNKKRLSMARQGQDALGWRYAENLGNR